MKVYIRNNESLDSALDRFQKKMEKAGIIAEFRSKTAYKSKKQRQRAEARQRDKKSTKNRYNGS